MPYCTLDDVNGCVPQAPFGPATVPNDVAVQQFIADITAEIDATLANMGYQVPITGAKSLALVEMACKWGAVGLAQDARYTAAIRDDMLGGARNPWTQRYMDWKRALVDPKNPYELPDAVRTATAIVKPLGQVESDTSTIDNTYATAPPFSVGMQW